MLKQRQGGTFKYLKIKDGKIKMSGDETPYDELSGVIVDLVVEDAAFEGRPYEQLNCVVQSEGDLYKLQMNFDSSIAQSFLSFIKSADLSKELTIVPIEKVEMKNGAEVKKRSVIMKQDGNWLKAYYTKDHPNGLPPMKQVTVSGKVLWDRGDMLAFYRNVILTEIKPNLTPVNEAAVASKSITEPVSSNEVEEDIELPF